MTFDEQIKFLAPVLRYIDKCAQAGGEAALAQGACEREGAFHGNAKALERWKDAGKVRGKALDRMRAAYNVKASAEARMSRMGAFR